MTSPHEAIRSLLYETFREKPRPIIRGEHFCIPGASIWSGARLWVNRLRELGVARHDRVVIDLPRTPAHVMATIACWWEGITLCPAAPGDDPIALLQRLGARLLLADFDHPCALRRGEDEAPDTRAGTSCAGHRYSPGTGHEGPAMLFPAPPQSAGTGPLQLLTSDLLLALTRHSGVSGIEPDEPWISHTAWHSAGGLLSGLWPALLSGAEVIVMPCETPHSDVCAQATVPGGSALPAAARIAPLRAA